ncbi:BCCT family transporter [Demequina sp. EGI L300058]|uniref:BCCT family transporter n=2 Tax=Demequina muriae TaxID=3051664 RepID=A0ABT8GFT0_9MICO|nr:BCCT family transporter [Demequina sp. EGI L300058]
MATTTSVAHEPMTKKTLATWVFWPSAVIILGFALFAIVAPGAAESAFATIQSEIIGAFGWYYVLIAAFFVAFALFIGFSKFGSITLGKDGEKPQFSMFSWFALLFAAGMGIGLVFYGVSEPLAHFASPRPGVTGAPEAIAQQAMSQTFLHWGVHAWSIYIVVGIAIAYAVHRKGRPVSIRYALEPLLGKRIHGAWGNVIDVTAVVGTLFGVATSLGLGVQQISSGLGTTGIAEPSTTTQIVLIIVITIITIFSLVTGLERGMKWLSNINLALAGVLLLYVLTSGPTVFLLREFVQSIGSYIQNFIGLSFNVSAFQGDAGAMWQADWTTFYWGWWISWAPFVGVFIARVSKGRTVREFVWGVLLVPAFVTFLWFSVLGGSALYDQLYGDGRFIAADGTIDYTGSLFQLLDGLPGGAVASFGAIVLIAVFFVTSSDSGSLVLSMLTSGGNDSPRRWLRVFWASTTALVAIALLVAGGLNALQTAAIITALPFSFVMLAMCAATLKAFRREHRTYLSANRAEFADHITERVGESYGLAAATDDVDPEGSRTHLPHAPHLPHWPGRRKPRGDGEPDATDPDYERHQTDHIVRPLPEDGEER